MTIYHCCDDLRREAVRAQNAKNAIDYLEVVDHDEPDVTKRQRVLRVHFVNIPPPAVAVQNVVIEGGERIRGSNIAITNVAFDGTVLVVTVDPRGDFSPYVLKLVEANGDPLNTLDPQLAQVEFSFKVECASDFDCKPSEVCRTPEIEAPRIDYLAKDYESFRRLMLDRMALLVPSWYERNPADLGIALVELLAYAGDHLSYQQDAVATEAYLATARRRTSVRRHTRLVDYRLHDGCNARTFVRVKVNAPLPLPKGTMLFTRLHRYQTRIDPLKLDEVLNARPTVFETMHTEDLLPDHNEMKFYTWRSRNCCLPKGATSATLKGAHQGLHAGQLLIFQEVVGPKSGEAADADPTHRHVVRLTKAEITEDPVREVPATPIPITEIEWDADDALPFPLCLSATTDQAHQSRYVEDVSVVYGNVVIADHGRTIPSEPIGKMPPPTIFRPDTDADPCETTEPVAIPPRFRPRLANAPLTQQGRIAAPTADEPRPAPFDPAAPASHAMTWPLSLVLPAIDLQGTLGTEVLEWEVRAELFSSEALSRHFVAEVEDDGVATIRFGDDDYGDRPTEDTSFVARYRIGNGTAGNIGAESIAHILTTDNGIDFVTNPMAAFGGIDPEAVEHARQAAPTAFRVQERAVTEADYAEVTQRQKGVDRAAATFRWTGSWYTLFDTVDRIGGLPVDAAYRVATRAFVERYRVIGNDLEVDPPRFVPLDVAMLVCVKPEFFRTDVQAELLDVFTNGIRKNGRPGFFHPDNFTFGQSLYLSRIYAAAQAVEGVESVTIIRFQRQGNAATSAISTGELPMQRLEIAQLENSRDFPERGKLELQMRGGR